MTTAQDAAKAGTLTAMLEDYDKEIIQPTQPDGAMHLSSLMDFNAGMAAALCVVVHRLKAGEPLLPLLTRLQAEAEKIHDRLNPSLYRKET